MGSDFKMLRRKLGVVTLVLACATTAGWVRSLTEFDALIRLNTYNTHIVISVEGTVSWETMWPIVQPRPSRWMYRHQTSKPHEGFDVPMGPHGLGFDFRDQSKIEVIPGGAAYTAESETWQIPYWSIVIPLTLISAWLLVSRPRKPKPHSESTLTTNAR